MKRVPSQLWVKQSFSLDFSGILTFGNMAKHSQQITRVWALDSAFFCAEKRFDAIGGTSWTTTTLAVAKGHNRLARSLNAFLQEIYTYVRAFEHGRLVVCIADVHSSIMRSQERIRVAFGSLRHNAAHRAMPWKTGGLVRTYVRMYLFFSTWGASSYDEVSVSCGFRRRHVVIERDGSEDSEEAIGANG